MEETSRCLGKRGGFAARLTRAGQKGCVSWRRYGDFPSTGNVEQMVGVACQTGNPKLRPGATLHQHRNLEDRPGVAKSVRKAHLISCLSLRALRIMMEQCSPKGVRMLKGQPDRRNFRPPKLAPLVHFDLTFHLTLHLKCIQKRLQLQCLPL